LRTQRKGILKTNLLGTIEKDKDLRETLNCRRVEQEKRNPHITGLLKIGLTEKTKKILNNSALALSKSYLVNNTQERMQGRPTIKAPN